MCIWFLPEPWSGFGSGSGSTDRCGCVQQQMAEARLPAILFGMWNQTGNVKICSVALTPPDSTTHIQLPLSLAHLAICIVLCWLFTIGCWRRLVSKGHIKCHLPNARDLPCSILNKIRNSRSTWTALVELLQLSFRSICVSGLYVFLPRRLPENRLRRLTIGTLERINANTKI